MKISDLEFWLVEITCELAGAPVRRLLVRLATDSGLQGWGEARIGWRADELPARRNSLLPVLIGRSIFDIEELLTLDVIRDAPLRFALETASWDLVGRTLDQPLCHLFGGRYRARIPISVRLPGGTPESVLNAARELAEQGFHSQIVTSSGQADVDREVVLAIRENTGDRTTLRLDGDSRYDMDAARDLCAELKSAGIEFFLDPLATSELYPVASLRRQTGVPLAVGSAIHGPADVLALVRCGAAHSAVVDLQQVGGLISARKCAAVSEAAGVEVSLNVGRSFGVAAAAMLHLAASSPTLANSNECGGHQLQDDLLIEPLEVVDGMIAVPQGPGLGVEIDRTKLERYQVTG